MLQKAARREAAEFLEELWSKELRRIGIREPGRLCLRFMLETARDDQARFFRRAAFQKCDGTRLLDAVDIGLGQGTANLTVEIIEARDDDDRIGQTVGDLNEVAHRFLEAFFRVVEETQIFDLIDGEDERRLVRPSRSVCRAR